jgi:hypothetical protein
MAAATEETDKRHPAAIPQGGQLTFQTLDGDTQQVNPDEIWRIRATSAGDEPPGAIVIDYAFERVYVKESLASVVEKVGGVRPLKKFGTLRRMPDLPPGRVLAPAEVPQRR